MQTATLTATSDGTRGRLTMNRPGVHNALSRELLADLARAARWFDEQPEVRVVVVEGAGPSFCAGYDLDDLAASLAAEEPVEEADDPAELEAAMADAIERMRAVTVARLQGNVVGGGVVVAAVCDFRIAAADTRFVIPEVAMGIPLGWGGLHRLVRDVGAMRAKELVMTARPFGADEAERLGFLTEAVEPDRLDAAVEDLVEHLRSMPAGPAATIKRQVAEVTAGQDPADATRAATQALRAATQDPQFRDIARRYLSRYGRTAADG